MNHENDCSLVFKRYHENSSIALVHLPRCYMAIAVFLNAHTAVTTYLLL